MFPISSSTKKSPDLFEGLEGIESRMSQSPQVRRRVRTPFPHPDCIRFGQDVSISSSTEKSPDKTQTRRGRDGNKVSISSSTEKSPDPISPPGLHPVRARSLNLLKYGEESGQGMATLPPFNPKKSQSPQVRRRVRTQ